MSEKKSIAFQSGVKAKRDNVKLEHSAIVKLKTASNQYEDFIAGYDSAEVDEPNRPDSVP